MSFDQTKEKALLIRILNIEYSFNKNKSKHFVNRQASSSELSPTFKVSYVS